MAERLEPLGRDALLHEVRDNALRAVLRERQVLGGVADVVGVTLDANLPNLEVREKDARNVVEIGLSNAIDLAIRLGGLLLDFPEHPDEGRAQTNHDNQK